MSNVNKPEDLLPWELASYKWVAKCKEVLKVLGTQNAYHALGKLKSLVARNDELESLTEKVCVLTGADNFGNALKKIEAVFAKSELDVAFESLPKSFHTPPPKWYMSETKKGEKMSLNEAWRQWRALKYLVCEVWLNCEFDEEREQVEKAYLTKNPKVFVSECYDFLGTKGALDDDEEEETPTVIETEPSHGEVAKSLKLVDPGRRY